MVLILNCEEKYGDAEVNDECDHRAQRTPSPSSYCPSTPRYCSLFTPPPMVPPPPSPPSSSIDAGDNTSTRENLTPGKEPEDTDRGNKLRQGDSQEAPPRMSDTPSVLTNSVPHQEHLSSTTRKPNPASHTCSPSEENDEGRQRPDLHPATPSSSSSSSSSSMRTAIEKRNKSR